MKVFSKNIQNGVIPDAFGKHGAQQLKGMPTRSFQVGWSELPEGTVSLALVFWDHDAVPVCGFTWIHWLVANIDPVRGQLPENASQTGVLTQGVNSWASPLLPDSMRLTRQEASQFGGSAPPDRDHEYELVLYALDTTLPLTTGFYYHQLHHAMEGHVLASARLKGVYRS